MRLLVRHLKGILDDLATSFRSEPIDSIHEEAVHCGLIRFSMGKGERGATAITLRLIQYLAVITLSSKDDPKGITVHPRTDRPPQDCYAASLSALPAALVRGAVRQTSGHPHTYGKLFCFLFATTLKGASSDSDDDDPAEDRAHAA